MEKKVVVLGAGESGMGAALLAKKKGYQVFVSEQNELSPERQSLLQKQGIEWESGKHSPDVMKNAEWVVKSPGIPSDSPLVEKLKKKGLVIVSEIEFAAPQQL